MEEIRKRQNVVPDWAICRRVIDAEVLKEIHVDPAELCEGATKALFTELENRDIFHCIGVIGEGVLIPCGDQHKRESFTNAITISKVVVIPAVAMACGIDFRIVNLNLIGKDGEVDFDIARVRNLNTHAVEVVLITTTVSIRQERPWKEFMSLSLVTVHLVDAKDVLKVIRHPLTFIEEDSPVVESV